MLVSKRRNKMKGWEEYEWAGHSKIRTTYAEAYRIAGSAMVKIAHGNEDMDVDIESPDMTFGPSQFSLNDLPDSKSTAQGTNINASDSGTSSSSRTTPVNNAKAGNELSEQLKSSTKEITNQHSVSKCAVCLDKLKDPLVSINCWHIHCESCWLNSLSFKLLCPRCTVITSPDDLRRVFL